MRILTEEGQDQFRNWVLQVKADEKDRKAPPVNILEDDRTSFEFPAKSQLPQLHGDSEITKLDLAEKLLPVIQEVVDSRLDEGKTIALYDTLALLYFPLISPKKGKLSGVEFYCYDKKWDRFYRHRIYGPYALLSCGGSDNVRPFFMGAPDVCGEYESNVGSRLHLAGNPQILQSIREIYESTNGDVKKGFANKTKFVRWDGKSADKGDPGTIRRIGEVTNQLAALYDVYDVDASTYLGLLPPEFAKMKNQ